MQTIKFDLKNLSNVLPQSETLYFRKGSDFADRG